MTLDDLATSVNWAFGLVIEDDKVKELAVTAARQFSAWGQLSGVAADQDDMETIVGSMVITSSEWGVIKPLFMLYVERENAREVRMHGNRGERGGLGAELRHQLFFRHVDRERRRIVRHFQNDLRR